MENQKTAEQQLDELSKDPKALEAALNAELSAADNQGADQKPSGESDPNSGDGESKKKTTADRFAEILSDRNEARQKALEAEAEKNKLANKVAELESTLATLQKTGVSTEDPKDPNAAVKDDKALTPDAIMKLVNDKVSEILSTKEQAALAEKSIVDEISATAEKPEFAGIKGREKELEGIMAKHPTLTAAAAYLLLVGIEKGQASDGEGSNAGKLGLGGRPNSDLLRDKKPAEMSTTELTAELTRLANSGQLNF